MTDRCKCQNYNIDTMLFYLVTFAYEHPLLLLRKEAVVSIDMYHTASTCDRNTSAMTDIGRINSENKRLWPLRYQIWIQYNF